MGAHENISPDRWPQQGSFLRQRVEVCFHFDTSRTFPGVIVRDDIEDPHRTIIRVALPDGIRYVLGIECQFRPI